MELTIAQFTFGLGLGGQERVVVDLAKCFHQLGYKSIVCTTQFGGPLVEELELLQIPFHTFGLIKSYDLRALPEAIRYLQDNNVNVVITHGASGCLVPKLAAILGKTPVLINVEHNISDDKKFAHILLNKILSTFSDQIICISENAKQSLLRVERINPAKVAVIPNGLNTDRFSEVHDSREKQKGPKRVGIVSRFYEQKGHIYFIEAAARVIKSFVDVEFIFVGDGTLKAFIEQKAEELALSKYCKFLGYRTDVDQLLQSFDIFVLPSLWEGLPISLLEAQYFGIAAIATDVGGIPEVITNGYNGLLVSPKDPASLAAAMLKVLNDDNLRNELGLHGKQVFARKFGADIMANAYIKLISEIHRSKLINVN